MLRGEKYLAAIRAMLNVDPEISVPEGADLAAVTACFSMGISYISMSLNDNKKYSTNA